MRHDHAYRLLFSHPRMVADLLRGFVRQPWTEALDLSTLERRNQSYVAAKLRRREGDLLWRVRCRGDWIYIYLLFELHSRVDPLMALRMMGYLALLYQDLVRQGERLVNGRLPPVLPLVVYNGSAPWTAPREVARLMQPIGGSLDRYRPSLRYLLIDKLREAKLSEADQPNLAALLFALERSRSPAEIERLLARLDRLLPSAESDELRRSFATFVRTSLLPDLFPEDAVPSLDDLSPPGLLA